MKKIYITSLLLILYNAFAFSQITITLSGCGSNTFFYYGTDSTGRNIYHDGSGQYSIEWNTTSNEWVIVYLPGYSVGYSNSFTSLPDPPCYGVGTWGLVTPGCGDVTGLFGNCQSTLTATDEYAPFSGIELFPNPGTGLFQISGFPVASYLDVYDMQGRLIYQSVLEGVKADIDLRQAEKGVYLYRLRDDDGKSVQGKLILY